MCSGSMPIWLSSARRRGEAEARISSGRRDKGLLSPDRSLLEPVGDPALGEIVRGHFNQNLVAGQHPDAILAHTAGGVGDDLVIVLELDPEGRIGKQFKDHAREFEHFFFSHSVSW